MAKAISRNQQIRYFLYHSISSTKPSFHSLSNALSRTKPLPLSPLVGLRNLGLQAMRSGRLGSGLNCYRFLCTSNSVNQSSSGSSGSSSGANSGKSESSGGSQKTSEQGKSIRGSPVSWMSFFLLVCTGAGLVYYYDREKKRHIEDITTASTSVKQGPSAGKAAIGGPFSLIDHNGKPVTEKDFFGKWTVVYFGFTHCPDICPDELQKLAAAVDKIKEKSGIQVIPVFISVDPERDTVEQVHEYVKEFHPNLIGLTGTPEEIKKTARAYRVYYMKTEEEGSDYLVDHSIVMYLMDPKMEFVKFFGKNNDVDMLTDGIINEIKQYNRVKA
ncbi:protein SCO1 homolog 1, mitochondrial isoform X1 [Nicotiana tabacum]|uniref:protein SCO1 homolog 1, mitochondrial isoform X1 n=1 Tax=Nicotiana tabacum TaxID=4097 RepID=UPI003F4E64A8